MTIDGNAIVTALVIGVLSGGVSAIGTVAVLRAHIEHIRETVARHEDWIHSLAGELGELRNKD